MYKFTPGMHMIYGQVPMMYNCFYEHSEDADCKIPPQVLDETGHTSTGEVTCADTYSKLSVICCVLQAMHVHIP